MITKESSYTELNLTEFYSSLKKADYDLSASNCSDNILYIPGNVSMDFLTYRCRYLFRKAQGEDYKLSIIEIINIK
jgi:hypothetical protein